MSVCLGVMGSQGLGCSTYGKVKGKRCREREREREEVKRKIRKATTRCGALSHYSNRQGEIIWEGHQCFCFRTSLMASLLFL